MFTGTANIANALPDTKQNAYAAPVLQAVDENYIQIMYRFTDRNGCLLLDRKTGEFRFFPANEDSGAAETAADTNIFGGTGALHAAGNMQLILDDNNVYFVTCLGSAQYGSRFCTDPTLQNKTVLFDFEQDVPAEIQESIRAAAGEYGLRGLISSFNSIDGDYLSASLADGTCMLLDRSSGGIRYYRC